MAQLPTIRDTGVTIQAPRSSLSAADIANPFQQAAQVLNQASGLLKNDALKKVTQDGENAVFRDPDGQLQVTQKKFLSQEMTNAYERASTQAYMARLSGDARSGGAEMATKAAGNPEAFKSLFKGFQDGLIAKAPRQLRGAVTTLLESEGARFGLGVSETKRNRDLKVFEGDIKAEIAALDDEASALALKGGTDTSAYRERQSPKIAD